MKQIVSIRLGWLIKIILTAKSTFEMNSTTQCTTLEVD